MQEKVSDLLAMAQDAKDGFDSACGAAENVRTKQAALRKFRGELVRLYQMQTEMAAIAGSNSEKRRLRTDFFSNWSVSARQHMNLLALLTRRWNSWQYYSNCWEVEEWRVKLKSEQRFRK